MFRLMRGLFSTRFGFWFNILWCVSDGAFCVDAYSEDELSEVTSDNRVSTFSKIPGLSIEPVAQSDTYFMRDTTVKSSLRLLFHTKFYYFCAILCKFNTLHVIRDWNALRSLTFRSIIIIIIQEEAPSIDILCESFIDERYTHAHFVNAETRFSWDAKFLLTYEPTANERRWRI